MIPCLQESCLEIEWDGEQSDDDVCQGEVSDEVVGDRLKGKAFFIFRQMSNVRTNKSQEKCHHFQS